MKNKIKKRYIYGLLNEHKEVIYVGMTTNLKRRMLQHKYRSLISEHNHNINLYNELNRIKFITGKIDYVILDNIEGNLYECELAESNHIKKYEGLFNCKKFVDADEQLSNKRERFRNWYQDNIESQRLRTKKFIELNPDTIRIWRKNNPEKYKAQQERAKLKRLLKKEQNIK